ncbi:hypothetical protein BDV32DRAFT_132613 [Aspergillus pseudonomiae]|nr:hypothetical protein BDV32DRAFT_132613 [Aspergillus pseudonomiae]
MNSNSSCASACVRVCLCWDQHFPSALDMPGPTCTCSTNLGTRSQCMLCTLQCREEMHAALSLCVSSH